MQAHQVTAVKQILVQYHRARQAEQLFQTISGSVKEPEKASSYLPISSSQELWVLVERTPVLVERTTSMDIYAK